jgi:hypothetical protein
MGVQAAGNQPLTHFITDFQKPNLTPAEVLEKRIGTLNCKSLAFSALEKISYVALIAIMGTILAISYSTVALTGGLPLVIAGMALATPLIAWGLTKFALLSHQFSKRAELERQVFLQLKQIENWRTPEINQFLLEERIVANRIPLESLRELNAGEPLVGLLPLIARFKYLQARSTEVETNVNNSRAELEAAFVAKEAADGKPIDPHVKQKIRFEAQNTAWRQHEHEGVSLVPHASVLLQLIQDPTQNLDTDPFSLDIPGIGTCVPKTFAERVFGRQVEPRNDDYFTFHPDLHREPLTLQTIEQNLQARDLRFVMFPNAIRA